MYRLFGLCVCVCVMIEFKKPRNHVCVCVPRKIVLQKKKQARKKME